jgi:glycosyltransferase involved in cell wall biosynthesis
MTRNVLICANPDLNYIDGSSIWAQTIALAFAATGEAKVDFIAKSPPVRQELFGPLMATANLRIIDGAAPHHWQGKGLARLSLPKMAELAVRLDRAIPYDVIVVRGLEIATTLLDSPDALGKTWMYLTDIPQSLEAYSPELRRTMARIAHGCHRLLCQTEGFRALWKALVPDLEEEKFHLYTPVIPDPALELPDLTERPVRAIYAGKFKGDWMTLDMAEAWPRIRDQIPGAELVMVGDKIHDEPGYPDYKLRMRQALEDTPGLTWLGAQSREATQQLLQGARVGLSWRSETMNDTAEYSTKILEYGGAGCAAILNRNPLHERLLGSDYPLYANSPAEFSAQLTLALTVPGLCRQAAEALGRLAARHSFSTRVDQIRQWLTEVPVASAPVPRTRVLVAGHDLKFFDLLRKRLETTGQFEFLIDQWQGHNRHDETQSRALLEKADVIFCEWCLGNLQWYSHNKLPHQRLVARFHAQELRTVYIAAANLNTVDHLSFVSEHTRNQALTRFQDLPIERTSVIPNFLDDNKFTPENKIGEARHTLGMIGVAPMTKRLDRAVDLLEALLAEDDRYCLRVKGKNPLDYEWLLGREEELAYYRALFQRINSSPKLRHRVIFDPPGDDVNEWFKMVGFILSPSDFESFHMAVGEGILTGTMPVIWNWDGAAEIWGEQWIVHSAEEAKKIVIEHARADGQIANIPKKLNSHEICKNWNEILLRGRTL